MGSFEVEADDRARAWLEAHPPRGPLVVSYAVHRCCGGGKICSVSVKESSRAAVTTFAQARLEGGPDLLIDPRAAARLPRRIGLTVRGLGPLRHLDLELEPEQWGDLLYD